MRRVILALCALTVALIGCDKRPQSDGSNTSDAASAAPAPAESPAAAPPQINFPLKIMPLTMTLPAGWKLDPEINPSFLEGPLPGGDVEISLSLMDSMADRNRQLFVTGALDQSLKHPERIRVRQLTTKSGLETIERITYLTPPLSGGSATTLPSQQLSWNFIIFVPYQQKFIPCSFDLLGLTQQQYDEDQPAIRSMIDSAEPVKTPAFQ
jgi:hypothetical protein